MTDEENAWQLSSIEARVLGSLMEKARTTPDIYPLSLNSLVTACNQKTSRDPVTDYDEEDVLRTLDDLRDKGLVMRVDVAGSRVPKFRENLSVRWILASQEYALLTLLFLRGPQTPGQLRGRSERLFEFAEIPQVQDWLKRMQEREEEPFCLVQSLPRLPGTKEIRFAHVLSGRTDESAVVDEVIYAPPSGASVRMMEGSSRPEPETDTFSSRLDALEERVANLENLIDDLTS